MPKKKLIETLGVTYMQGISGVFTLIPLLLLAQKQFVVVADSDNISTNKRKEFNDTYAEYSNNWLAYADVEPNASTMEDFLTPAYIEKYLRTNGHPGFSYNNQRNAIQNIESVVGQDKEQKQQIKNGLIDKIKKDDIKECYATYVDRLLEKVKDL